MVLLENKAYIRFASTERAVELGDVWCCPRCLGSLEQKDDILNCFDCSSSYPTFDGIPDLRLPGESWIDYEEDRQQARRFIVETRDLPLAEQIRWCFAARQGFTPEQIDVRVSQVLSAVDNLTGQIDEWLGACFGPGSVSLDLGCGPGQLIAAAAKRGQTMIGIDVRLLWLLAAKRLIAAHGGQPILAAALAEHMPLRTGALHSVVSLDVIEHVANVPCYLAEINRVTGNGGTVALSTPNRYSLAAEPHVGVWGVGWVPRRWQKQYVRWRKNVDYPYTSLLSVAEMCSLLRRHTHFRPTIMVPPVPEYEIRRFPAYRKTLAKVYNVAARQPLCRLPLLAIGPFFRVVATKNWVHEGGKHHSA